MVCTFVKVSFRYFKAGLHRMVLSRWTSIYCRILISLFQEHIINWKNKSTNCTFYDGLLCLRDVAPGRLLLPGAKELCRRLNLSIKNVGSFSCPSCSCGNKSVFGKSALTRTLGNGSLASWSYSWNITDSRWTRQNASSREWLRLLHQVSWLAGTANTRNMPAFWALYFSLLSGSILLCR